MQQSIPDILSKSQLRNILRATRRALSPAARAEKSAQIAAHFLQSALWQAHTVIAGYAETASEVAALPTLHALHTQDKIVGLPRITEDSRILSFHRWTPETSLIDGPHRTREPALSAELLTPTLVLVPLLGFDSQGHRIGQGGGFYDATLTALRTANPSLTAVGLAFAAQACDSIPRDTWDARLNAVVTEHGVQIFR